MQQILAGLRDGMKNLSRRNCRKKWWQLLWLKQQRWQRLRLEFMLWKKKWLRLWNEGTGDVGESEKKRNVRE